MSDNGKRQNVKRYDTQNLQGDGSWIEVRLALIGESRVFTKEAQRLKIAASEVDAGSEEGDALVAEATKLGHDWYGRNVIAWNWKDEDGNPLPIPSIDPGVLDLLTQPEVEYLAAAINGSAEDQKKRPKR